MTTTQHYRVKIDQLPEETIEADSAQDAARRVGRMIESQPELRRLADEEPVAIKHPDGRPWGRNMTIGAFRRGDLPAEDGAPDGPEFPPSV